jgi:transcriptional regulator with XRE-family HTH domain
MLDRISLILRTKNISAAQFADKIDVQRSSISHVLSGRNKPSLEFIQKILKSFPEIRPDWLLFGKGAMLLEETDLFSIPATDKSEVSNIRPEQPGIDDKVDKLIKDKPFHKSKQEDQVRDSFEVKTKYLKKVTKGDETKKKAEKIVIFYNDKTFSVYYPDN